MGDLSKENLLALDDQNVQELTLSVFQQQLKVSSAIYPPFGGNTDTPLFLPVDQSFIDSVAVSIFSDIISRRYDPWGFCKSIDGTTSRNYWQRALVNDATNNRAIIEAQSIYKKAFVAHCTAPGSTLGPSLLDYVKEERNSPSNWTQVLSQVLTSNSWIQSYLLKWFTIDQPSWWKTLNVNLYKLMFLEGAVDTTGNPTASKIVPDIVALWKKSFSQASISIPGGFNMDELLTVNWLMRQQFKLNSGYFNLDDSSNSFTSYVISSINNAENTQRKWSEKHVLHHPPEVWTDYYVSYGDQVKNWLEKTPGKTYCVDINKIDNVRSDDSSSGGCFVEGTLVAMSDGSMKPIEKITSKDVILSAYGVVSTNSDEMVFVEVDSHYKAYGFELIDDDTKALSIPPFVTAGHLFLTDEGWKAIDPTIAKLENPHRIVGELKPGDWIYRIDAINPYFRYKRMKICSFINISLKQGDKVYGIYINDGAQSYHANGFLVAMNYPQLTLSRMIGAISALPEEKREYTVFSLLKVLPMLRSTLGHTITAALLNMKSRI